MGKPFKIKGKHKLQNFTNTKQYLLYKCLNYEVAVTKMSKVVCQNNYTRNFIKNYSNINIKMHFF